MLKMKKGTYKTLERVDKHGNRHYRTNICKKCGGTGNVGYTLDDGRCWRCGGTGIEAERKTVEYTPEQQQLRTEKATAKRLGTVEQQLRAMGFNPATGKAYIAKGDTFAVKDQLREAGGRWDPWKRRWVLPERPDFCECDEVTTDALEFEEYGEFVRYTVVRWKHEEA